MPWWADGGAGGHGVLRLRTCPRFAWASASLRMTKLLTVVALKPLGGARRPKHNSVLMTNPIVNGKIMGTGIAMHQ